MLTRRAGYTCSHYSAARSVDQHVRSRMRKPKHSAGTLGAPSVPHLVFDIRSLGVLIRALLCLLRFAAVLINYRQAKRSGTRYSTSQPRHIQLPAARRAEEQDHRGGGGARGATTRAAADAPSPPSPRATSPAPTPRRPGLRPGGGGAGLDRRRPPHAAPPSLSGL